MHWHILKAENEMYLKKYGVEEINGEIEDDNFSFEPLKLTPFGEEVGHDEIRWWVFKKENNVGELWQKTKDLLEFSQKLKDDSSSLEAKFVPKSYKEHLSIPKKHKTELPSSYDVIGDIILIKLPESLSKYKKEIGTSLLLTNKNIKTICLAKPVEGELRTRNLEIIAGEKNLKTNHKEYGLKFEMDLNKTYFSPRLATERKRVTDSVKSGEIVVDMFAGVAPFSIMIAKYANPKVIYAFDKNKYAIDYGKKNIKINNVLNKIEIFHNDAKNVNKILNQKKAKADRVIMNLPFSAYLFFKYALDIIGGRGIIHYYDILGEEKINQRIGDLKRIAKEKNVVLTNINQRKIKTYAPREFYIGIDITAKRMPM